mgnify:CR=1 FL=1
MKHLKSEVTTHEAGMTIIEYIILTYISFILFKLNEWVAWHNRELCQLWFSDVIRMICSHESVYVVSINLISIDLTRFPHVNTIALLLGCSLCCVLKFHYCTVRDMVVEVGLEIGFETHKSGQPGEIYLLLFLIPKLWSCMGNTAFIKHTMIH